ncbi:MAG: DUF5916 domain-containing protein [Saprospiraceae bacterium]|nr:DUF5916 domain-containing protein [Saprospiraceae bacterium]
MKKLTLLLLLSASSYFAMAQSIDFSKKTVSAFRTEKPIILDGVLNEEDWQNAAKAIDFIQNQPAFGAMPDQPTEVKILYDNTGLYIGAMLHDTKPDSILQELSQRDNLGNTDWFGLFIDAYRDGINGFGFIVTPANVQFDAKYSTMGEDEGWDAVWESKTQITPEGWVVEIKIPYSAIRFPKVDEQTWHINFGRMIRRLQQKNFWSPVNPQVNGFLNQAGYLTEVRNIKSPLRLQATPFVAIYGERYHDNNNNPVNSFGRSFNGGMDIKYGINDAFTLDMTLIPDFGEAQSDNQVLNLSPFEVQFNENRQFFTEGTELFNKGNLFYSRRIGGQPLHYGDVYNQLNEGETIVENPQQAQLYNATKISGRTTKGLGIGFFNATSGRSFARVGDAEGGEREIETDPLTNFNVFVLDQNLKYNSFVSLINTTVLRNGEDYDANVTGTVFSLRNKTNTYEFAGKGVVSQQYFKNDSRLGHSYNLNLRKIGGNWIYGLYYSEDSDTYDINDLGYLPNNNVRAFQGWTEYNVYKAFWKFNRGGVGFWNRYARIYNPDVYSDYGLNTYAWAETKGFWHLNIFTYHEPFVTYDYFEARTPGRFYRYPTNNNYGFEINTDSRKRFRVSVETNFRNFSETGRYRWNWYVSPRYRVNDKLNFQFSIGANNFGNDVGFVNKVNNNDTGDQDIIFGRRDQLTLENIFTTAYNFSQNMALTFRMRHYWSRVEYDSYHMLLKDGGLADTNYTGNHNGNFDAFNIDMIYRWRFAPGSDIFIIWKNALLNFDEEAQLGYFDNLNGLFRAPNSNSLSLKVIYFLDYNNIVKSHR